MTLPAASQLRDWLVNRRAELRLALRVTIAGAVAFILAHAFSLTQGYWAVITAVIVMQASVGGSLKAAIDRFLGTFAGALYGAAVAAFIPHGSVVQLGGAVVAALAPLAFLAAVRTSFRVAPITALIVLLGTSVQTLGPLASAIERVFEITLGNVVGVTVALFVLPARAHTLLTESAAQVVRLNAQLMAALMNALVAESGGPVGVAPLHASIRASLKQVETAADEASRERKTHLTDAPDPEPLVRTLYRVRHDFVMIGRAASGPLPGALRDRLQPFILTIRDTACALLTELGDALQMRAPPPTSDAIDASLADYAKEMDALRTEHLIEDLPSDAIGRLYALQFAFEQFRQDLDDLTARTHEMALRDRRDGETGEAS
ncbi:FUSC family protein [Microvirga alba]|uniref:FUSC family protein n=1 Tax=Microvirga alba TaxID=2791025 RepID=A0A931BS08_9HYPH|nr:FUSC family protein [Microvirga alba]MBF9234958.1 FUSC family protein [Microvirga alba]